MIMYSETSENLLCTVRLMRTDYVVYSETDENWLWTVRLVRTDYVQWDWWELIMYSETGENFANLMQNEKMTVRSSDLNSLVDI